MNTGDDLGLTHGALHQALPAELATRTILLGGPGSGKTALLGERAAALIADGSARPQEVLVLAPSRRAAEAVARLARRRLDGRPGPQAASFPAFALGLVRRHFRALGYSRQPSVLDTSEHFEVIREVLAGEDSAAWGAYGPALRGQVLRTLAYDTAIGAAQNGLDEDELLRRGEAAGPGSPLRELAGFYGRYRRFLRTHNLLDFGQLQAEAARLLVEQPNVAEEYRQAYPFILVDECEETSFVQARLLEGLVGPRTELLVAGDPEQGIGSFRGGSPSNLLALGERLGAQVVQLEGHGRAGERLRRLWGALRPQGEPPVEPAEPAPNSGTVSLRSHAYLGDEARWLAVKIERLLHEGGKPDGIAVIFRSLGSPLVRLLQAELERRGIPYCTPANGTTNAQPLLRATRDLLAYLAGDDRDACLTRLLDSPLAGLPPFGLDEARRLAALTRLPLLQWLDGDPRTWGAGEAVQAALVALRERLGALQAKTEWSMGALLWEIWRLFPALAEDAQAGGAASRAYGALLGEVARIEEGGRSLTLNLDFAW